MLAIALIFPKVFERLDEEDAGYKYYFDQTVDERKRKEPLKEEDWENATMLMGFLKLCCDTTLKFSVNISVSSDCYFHEIWNLQPSVSKQYKATSNPILKRKKNTFRLFGDYESSVIGCGCL